MLVLAEGVSLVVLRQVGEARIDEQATDELLAAAEPFRTSVADTLEPGSGALTEVFDDYLRTRPARTDQAYLALRRGEPYAVSAGAPVELDRLPEVERWADLSTTTEGTTTTAAGATRWLAVPVVAGSDVLGTLVVAQFTDAQSQALESTVVTVSLVTLLLLAGAALLAWVAAGRALVPLRRLARTAESVSGGGDLDARIEVVTDDETGHLARSFNAMLDRLRGAFDSQRQFLDDAGHELRAPITIVRGHVELLDDDPAVRQQEVALVLDELDRMDRLVTDLRLLARSQRPDFLSTAPVDVDAFVTAVAAKAGALGERTWVVSADSEATVRVDAQRLTQAVLNLADNAVRVTDADATIEIGARRDGDATVTFWVADDGPGIDPADVPHLFDRTQHTVPTRPGGTGLGLPIVEAIVRAHGGRVAVHSDVGVGTRIELTLPEAPA
nr:HAMP domain-containing sensor histidine kinase [Rhabdothermincola salaria]